MDGDVSRSLWRMLSLWPNIQAKFIFYIQNPNSTNFTFRCAQPTTGTSSTESNAWNLLWKNMDPLWVMYVFLAQCEPGARHTLTCLGVLWCEWAGALYGLKGVPPKFSCWSPNDRYLEIWLYLEIGSLKRQLG